MVYLARDLRLHDMPVVIKFLLDDSSAHPWLSKKFLQEAEALTRIHHPGVVRVIDRDSTADGQPFFVMEFVKGASLRSAIRPTGLDLETAAAIVRDLGQALGAAHREGVLHRDLKPENVMLETLSDGEQRAKLIDFGIAKVADSREGASTQLGTLAGSLFYLAPEQLLGQPASVASDVYAFAAVAYELLTGRRPFIPESSHHLAAITQLMTLQRDGVVVPPRELRPSLSEAAQAILLRGLAFDPAARLADARQFGDDLAQALAAPLEPTQAAVTLPGGAVLPGPASAPAAPPVPDRSPAAPPRRTGLLVAVAAALLAAIAAAIYVATSRSSPAVPPTLHVRDTPEPETSPEPAGEPVTRALTYTVTRQRVSRRFPDAAPVPVTGDVVFAAGDRVRLAFISAQGGHLYVFNEGPPEGGAPGSVNVLFPSPTSNDGSARIAAGQTVSVPDGGDGFVFDPEAPGVEQLWIVWAESAQADLDPLGRRYANRRDRGEITAPGDVEALRAFLRAHAAPDPKVEVDEASGTTVVSAPAAVFVRKIPLAHQ